MTNEQKRLVLETFPRIQESATGIGLLFYGRLFALNAELRSLFRIDMRVQTRKLMDMLGSIIGALDHMDEMGPRLRELGERHAAEYGVKPEDYQTLESALIWAIGQALEQDFYPDVREAWRAAIREINALMLGYGSAPSQ